ncbi:hypothetical protein MCETHM1_00875 [Flavobacteriaceae bacterium]
MLELLIKLGLIKIDLLRIRKKKANICVHTIGLLSGSVFYFLMCPHCRKALGLHKLICENLCNLCQINIFKFLLLFNKSINNLIGISYGQSYNEIPCGLCC